MNRDIYARLRTMLPIAKERLANEGIGLEHAEFSENIPADEPKGMTEQQTAMLVEWTEATYVLGIAVGLLLNSALVLDSLRANRHASKGGGR